MAPAGWTDCQLGQVITLQRGYDITKAAQEEGPYPVISSSGPSSFHAQYKAPGPGVVIGRKGSLGGVYFAPGPYWPHDTTLWVRDFHGNDPRFIYYFLHTLHLEQYDVGASNPTLNRNHVHLLRVLVPPATSQRKIASILSAYDDLIDNNRRRIELLEEIAQRIYREWFIDFCYPGHEDVPLVESEIGPVPLGWPLTHLADLVSTQYGYTASASDLPVGPRFLRGMDMNKASFIDWSTVPYCGMAEKDHAKYRLRRGDILVIRMADPGKVGIVEADIDAVFASYLIRLMPTNGRILPYCLFYFLGSDRYQAFVAGASTGTTRKSLSAPGITAIDFAVPPISLQRAFDDAVRPTRELLGRLVAANAALRTSRDLLLPRLMTGEIDVDEPDISGDEAAA